MSEQKTKQSAKENSAKSEKQDAKEQSTPAFESFFPQALTALQVSSAGSRNSFRPADIIALQRTIGNKSVQRFISGESESPFGKNDPQVKSGDQQVSPAFGPGDTIQRDDDKKSEENRKTLEPIQGSAMFALLPKLAALPADVLNDETTGQHVGGPRLVTAMRVVKASGTNWLTFAASHDGELASLPPDQVGDIMRYLKAPKKARFFAADQFENYGTEGAGDFKGRFDGSVDPDKGVITLYFRVKFEAQPMDWEGMRAGTDEWNKVTTEAIRKFKPEFKKVVEEAWSLKGTVRPVKPVGEVKPFQTRVNISAVEEGEHAVFYIRPASDTNRSQVSHVDGHTLGKVRVSDNDLKPTDVKQPVMDEKGRPAGTVDNEQRTSAHEFGHAIGLGHPVHGCHDDRDTRCYGKTAKERQSVMGAGMNLKVIKRGGEVRHNDFAPFIEIARRWGKDILPGSLDKWNDWTAG